MGFLFQKAVGVLYNPWTLVTGFCFHLCRETKCNCKQTQLIGRSTLPLSWLYFHEYVFQGIVFPMIFFFFFGGREVRRKWGSWLSRVLVWKTRNIQTSSISVHLPECSSYILQSFLRLCLVSFWSYQGVLALAFIIQRGRILSPLHS